MFLEMALVAIIVSFLLLSTFRLILTWSVVGIEEEVSAKVFGRDGKITMGFYDGTYGVGEWVGDNDTWKYFGTFKNGKANGFGVI